MGAGRNQEQLRFKNSPWSKVLGPAGKLQAAAPASVLPVKSVATQGHEINILHKLYSNQVLS